MSEDAFLLDTNVFVEAHQRYYGLDLCPGFWEVLSHFNGRGRLRSIDRVEDEIRDREDALTEWVRDAPGDLFASSGEPGVVAGYQEIMEWVEAGDFRDPAKALFAGGADGWLISYARAHSLVLVTHEQYAPEARRKVPMPNVCEQFDVQYMLTFDMLRNLEVAFHWEEGARA